jgi:hypothetical protein
MTPFTIFSTATGTIIRTGIVRMCDLQLQVMTGESILTGVQGNVALQKVDISKNPPVLIPLQ